MDLLETYDKNKKKHSVKEKVKNLLKEVTVASSVGTFTGTRGNYIDTKFAGGFHEKFGKLKDLLKTQVDNDIMKRMYTDDITPMSDQDFIDMEWDYIFDENEKIDNSKFKTITNKMQQVDLEIKYDKIIDKTEENKKFVNDTNDWKSIYDSKKY